MQIRYLEYLLEIERAGSINKAARSLYISPQGLDRALDQVESELDTKIAERSRRGVRFTEKGHVFLDHARAIVEEYSRALGELADHEEHERAVVQVHASTYVVLGLLGHVLPNLRRNLNATYSECLDAEALARLSAGERGLFLIDWVGELPLDGQVMQERALVVEQLHSSKMGAVMADPGRRRSITLGKLERMSIVSYGRSDYSETIGHIVSNTRKLRVVARLSDPAAIGEALAHYEDSCALSDRLTYRLRGPSRGPGSTATAFVPLEPPIWLNVGFVYSATDPMAAAYQEIVGAWKSAFARMV